MAYLCIFGLSNETTTAHISFKNNNYVPPPPPGPRPAAALPSSSCPCPGHGAGGDGEGLPPLLQILSIASPCCSGRGKLSLNDVELLQAGFADEQGGQFTHNVEELPGGVGQAAPDRDIHRDSP